MSDPTIPPPDSAVCLLPPRQAGPWKAMLAVFVTAIAMLLPNLGDAPLAGTEGHRALSAHQMVESGEYLVPHLYGRTYLRKPPLHYWCIAIAEKAIGTGNELIWRLPSVLEYALLAALLAWAGRRFFETTGAWVSGVSLLAIVPLWAQARTADIDTLNNLTAGAAGIAILLLPTACYPRSCALAGGLALGACLMTKGPAGLPIVIGATVVSLLASRLFRDYGFQRRIGWVLLAWLIGVLIFAVYAIAVAMWFRSRGLPLDLSGLDEGAGNLRPDSLARFLRALILPISLVIFALPVSIALLIILRSSVRRVMEGRVARHAVMIALTVLIAWGVQLLTGMHNERYAYPTLPLLALLPGAVVLQLSRFDDRQRRQLRAIVTIIVIGWFAGLVALAISAWTRSTAKDVLVGIIILGLAMTGWALFELLKKHRFRGMIAMLVLIPLAGIAFGDYASHRRVDRSGLQAAQTIRRVVGAGNPCIVGAILRYQPELLHYAGVRARAYREDIPRPEELKESAWLILLDDAQNLEYQRLYQPHANQLRTVVPFRSNGKPCYAVYFEVR